MKSVMYCINTPKNTQRVTPPQRAALTTDRKTIMRANCHRLACATQPESVPYVFLVGAAWQIAARTRATARGVATQDMIALVWIGLGARRAAGRGSVASVTMGT